MRNRIAAALVALALLAPVAGFSEDKPGPYVSVGGALVSTRDAKATDDTLGVRISGEFGLKRGYGFTLAGGYALGNGLRTELELGYRVYHIKDLTVDPITYTYTDSEGSEETVTLTSRTKGPVRAKVNNWSVMGNALYVFHELGIPILSVRGVTKAEILPYAGAGIGLVHHKVGDITFPHLPGYRFKGDSDSTFGYQIMLGIKYPVETLGLGYRLTGSTKPDFDGTEVSYLAHNLDLGVTLRF